MIASRLLLLGSTLCLGACLSSGYPEIRPIAGQASAPETPFERAFTEGKHELASGHPGLAIVAFEKASRIDPLSVGALNGIGASYDVLKRYDVALGYYQRALLLAPKNTATINNIAVSLRLAHDPAADQWFEKAAKLSPGDPAIAANIAQARLEKMPGAADEPIREAAADEPAADSHKAT